MDVLPSHLPLQPEHRPSPNIPPPTHVCYREGDLASMMAAIVEIKNTLHGLRDLLTSNAVLEEQASRFSDSITELNRRLLEVELRMAQMSGSNKWIEKVVWAVAAAGLTYLLTGKLQL
ncbi:MAG: hypothetical protein IJA79_09510 [Desulfovibrio sp.]|nr:hypothetical protein [Desulfovibrio sp.]